MTWQKRTIGVALVALALAACRRAPPAGLTRGSLTVGGEARSYLLYAPDAGAEPRPLVLLFHGHDGSAAQLSGQDGKAAPFRVWQHIADEEPLALAYLDGLKGSDGNQGWNDCRADAQTNPTGDDVAFASQLIDALSAQLPVDRSRVYAAGVSNGGLMVYRLATELPDKVAAVAAVVANLPASSECRPATVPVSVMLLDGTEDPLMPFDGGAVGEGSVGQRGAVLSAPATAALWADLDSAGPAQAEDLPDLDPGDGTTIHRETRTADGGLQVVFLTVHGGGHVEPSTTEHYSAVVTAVLGKQSHDLESAREIWAFFKGKRLP